MRDELLLLVEDAKLFVLVETVAVSLAVGELV